MERKIARWAAIAVLLVAAPTSLRAQEKLAIKLKEIGIGETLRVESKETTVSKSQTMGEKDKQAGKATEEKFTRDLLFLETVVERPAAAKMPSKVKRVYEKAALTNFMDGIAGAAKPQSYHGKTVLIEKKQAAYEFRIEGGDAFKDPALDNEFNGGQQESHKRLFVPSQPVAVGGTWKVDTTPLLHGFKSDEKVTVKKAEGTGKLVKAYKKDGRQFGVIETAIAMEFTVEVKEADPKTKGTLSATQKLTMKVTFEGCVDGMLAEGRVDSASEYHATSVFRAPDMPAVTFITSGTTTGNDTWTEVAKK
jgi:hypothetical protein